MKTEDYLNKFRKCSSLDTLELLFDKLHYASSDEATLYCLFRAADHRRAELTMQRYYDIGAIPKSVWSRVR